MSGLVRIGMGIGPGSPICGLGSVSLQSNSGSNCFIFKPLSLMGSAHLEKEVLLGHSEIKFDT